MLGKNRRANYIWTGTFFSLVFFNLVCMSSWSPLRINRLYTGQIRKLSTSNGKINNKKICLFILMNRNHLSFFFYFPWVFGIVRRKLLGIGQQNCVDKLPEIYFARVVCVASPAEKYGIHLCLLECRIVDMGSYTMDIKFTMQTFGTMNRGGRLNYVACDSHLKYRLK